MNYKRFIIISSFALIALISISLIFMNQFMHNNSIVANGGKVIDGKIGDTFNFEKISIKILDGVDISNENPNSVEYGETSFSENQQTHMSKIILNEKNRYWQLYFNNNQSNKDYTTITITKDRVNGEVIGIYKIAGGHNYCIYNSSLIPNATYYISFATSNDSLSGNIKYVLTDNIMI